MYKKGYLRTSSDDYDMSNPNNYVHLTNNCLQKFGDNYGRHEDGNTLGFEVFQEYLDEKFPGHDVSVQRHIIRRIKDLIIDTFNCAKKSLNPNKRRNCFELFGYDFLVDEDLRTWLIEVNTNPYLGIPNDYIRELLPRMIDDMLALTVDPLYPPKVDVTEGRPNDFELIYSEAAAKSVGLFQFRSPFLANIYPIQALAQRIGRQRLVSRQAEEPPALSLHKAKVLSAELFYSDDEGAMAKIEQRKKKKEETGLLKQVDDLLYAYMYPDYEAFHAPTRKILSRLSNWELFSDIVLRDAYAALRFVAESRINTILTERPYLSTMLSLIDSENSPLDMQLACLDSLLGVVKIPQNKEKLLAEKVIQVLNKISLSTVDEETEHVYDEKVKVLAIRILCTMLGLFLTKMYIPGQTRIHKAATAFVIRNGGLMALLIVEAKAKDEQIKAVLNKSLFACLEPADWALLIETGVTPRHIPELEDQIPVKNEVGLKRKLSPMGRTMQTPKRNLQSSNGDQRGNIPRLGKPSAFEKEKPMIEKPEGKNSSGNTDFLATYAAAHKETINAILAEVERTRKELLERAPLAPIEKRKDNTEEEKKDKMRKTRVVEKRAPNFLQTKAPEGTPKRTDLSPTGGIELYRRTHKIEQLKRNLEENVKMKEVEQELDRRRGRSRQAIEDLRMAGLERRNESAPRVRVALSIDSKMSQGRPRPLGSPELFPPPELVELE
eukprot:TRINITY_DN3604_c0_g1_i1.p1 TRINITY_DN3604_c0_g1~~TRINITY_DN3604_c0_g1_i1.p1  ORF type:complete len:720 (+),score=168.57 TRINITY_DN3604_c0_g1_i1:850-3009(+)